MNGDTARFSLRQSEHFSLPFVPNLLFPPLALIPLIIALGTGMYFLTRETETSRRCRAFREGREGLFVSREKARSWWETGTSSYFEYDSILMRRRDFRGDGTAEFAAPSTAHPLILTLQNKSIPGCISVAQKETSPGTKKKRAPDGILNQASIKEAVLRK